MLNILKMWTKWFGNSSLTSVTFYGEIFVLNWNTDLDTYFSGWGLFCWQAPQQICALSSMLIALERENHYLCSKWFEMICPRSASPWGSVSMQQTAFPLCAKWLPEKINVASQCVAFSVRYLNLCVYVCAEPCVPGRTEGEGSSDKHFRRHHKLHVQTARITATGKQYIVHIA